MPARNNSVKNVKESNGITINLKTTKLDMQAILDKLRARRQESSVDPVEEQKHQSTKHLQEATKEASNSLGSRDASPLQSLKESSLASPPSVNEIEGGVDFDQNQDDHLMETSDAVVPPKKEQPTMHEEQKQVGLLLDQIRRLEVENSELKIDCDRARKQAKQVYKLHQQLQREAAKKDSDHRKVDKQYLQRISQLEQTIQDSKKKENMA